MFKKEIAISNYDKKES